MRGRCLCGAVTVTAVPVRQALAACHCDMCRRWSSSAFMAFEAETVKAEGPVRTFTSSEWAERAFCERCGSNLWYRITAPGPMHGQHQLAAGLFDVGDMPIKLEVFIDKKPPGYAFAGERKQMTEQEVFDLYAPKDAP